ncbi:MAG TPA: hypothetical protein VML55_17485, partial [Planctomycetaceae bacterium]|nr:hypothetical protein [Planctomycetaceae bacterium]
LLQGEHRGSLLGLAFSPDGKLLASSARDGTVKLWDFRAARLVRSLSLGPPGGTIRDVAFSPDGNRLAALNGNGTVAIVDLRADVD